MIFHVATLYNKYQNGNLNAQDLQRYHFFSCKMAVRCSNLNSKMGSLKCKPAILASCLNLPCSEYFWDMIEVEFEWYLKEKMYPNVRSTTFLLGDFAFCEQKYYKNRFKFAGLMKFDQK